MSPAENFDFINEYLGLVSPIIREPQGVIDRDTGDAVMALFAGNPENALKAAIVTLKRLSDYNAQRAKGNGQPVTIGIGLNTGSLMLGIVGEKQRMQGDIFSDDVNLAHRLEGLSKRYGVSIVVSENTLEKLANRENYHTRFLGKVQVKGKQTAVAVYEIFNGEPERMIDLKLKTKADFERGLAHYTAKEFADASVCFNTVVKTNPDDKTAKLYLERSAQFMVQGVPEAWQGVEAMEGK
jgi:class 3 adenylate cyclase